MGNKKVPKKVPPLQRTLKPPQTVSHDMTRPTEELSTTEKDIGAQALVVDASSSSLKVPLTAMEVVLKKSDKETTLDAVTVELGKDSGVKPPEPAAEIVNKVSEGLEVQPRSKNSWADLVKGPSKQLRKRSNAFTLDSGEACIKIPNSVIDRNKKAWDCFVLGQFYSNPPSHGTLHNIVNGIWSKYYRDIAVSKMGEQAFLFRIPNAATRQRVLTQRLWQIEGRTMFVAKWEPGVSQEKPELTSAPIWLELRDVPLQFFNEEGLEHIASLVGEPKFLHPTTENKTNLEVAKVFTVIDPRQPLPEAVNVQYESGEIRRIRVSSPWMPPVCGFCNDIGHSLKHCRTAPITCTTCDSTVHSVDVCPRRRSKVAQDKSLPQGRSNGSGPVLSNHTSTSSGKASHNTGASPEPQVQDSRLNAVDKGKGIAVEKKGGNLIEKLPRPTEKLILGGGNVWASRKQGKGYVGTEKSSSSGNSSSSTDLRDEDSSDHSNTSLEEEEYQRVFTQRQRKALRGKGLKHTL